jgi:hypothetical protein
MKAQRMRRRVERAPFAILTLESLRRHNMLEPELQPTHRYFLRWAAGSGTGLANPDARERETHFDPLPEREAIIVDQMVLRAPGRMPKLMKRWYRSDMDSRAIAEAFGVSRTQIYVEWRSALWYFRGRFEGVGFDVMGTSLHGV